MNATLSLPSLKARGIELWAEGETLRYRPPTGAITPDLLSAMKVHKPELLRTLRLEKLSAEACKAFPGYLKPQDLLHPDDVEMIAAMPDPAKWMNQYAVDLVESTMVHRGEVPPWWKSRVHCRHCGWVWGPELGVRGSCWWCWNRLHGVKIPRPREVLQVAGRVPGA